MPLERIPQKKDGETRSNLIGREEQILKKESSAIGESL